MRASPGLGGESTPRNQKPHIYWQFRKVSVQQGARKYRQLCWKTVENSWIQSPTGGTNTLPSDAEDEANECAIIAGRETYLTSSAFETATVPNRSPSSAINTALAVSAGSIRRIDSFQRNECRHRRPFRRLRHRRFGDRVGGEGIPFSARLGWWDPGGGGLWGRVSSAVGTPDASDPLALS